MIRFIKQKWSDSLNIGRKNNIHYLELQRIALLNAVAIISLFLSFTIFTIYYSLGFSNKYVPLIMIPICFSVLWSNKIGKYRLAKNIAFLGFLISITFWSFYTRRSGAELFYITLACSSASIFKRKKTIFLSMFVCGIFYFLYAIYDNVVPFQTDPTINYFFINTLLAFTTAGVVFFQIMLFVDLTNHFSKSLDKKYDELNFAFDKQKGTEDKLKNSNIELLSFNNKLDQLVKKSNSELQSYQTAINDNLYSIVTDLDGTILKINDNFINACGYTKAELLGKNFTILNSDFHSENFYKSISERIDAGKVWRGETKNRAKDGSFFWIISSILPIFDSKKKVVRFFTISVNITDKKNAEEKEKLAVYNLTKSEKRLRLLLENQTDLIVITNSEGKRRYVNQSFCNFFGKERDYFIGSNYRTLDTKIAKETYLEIFKKLTVDNPKIKSVSVLENANGEKRWIEWNEVALFDSNDNVIEILSIGHDISELKEIEFQNANYIAQFEELAFKNSHHFRSPLSNVMGIIDLLDNNESSKEEIKELINIMKVEISDLDGASRELSAFINSYHSRNHKPERKSFNIDFIEAKSKHLNWRYKIRNYLDGTGTLTANQAVSHLHCDIGKWYYNEGKDRYGHLPPVQKFEIEHEKLHNLVREILELKSIDEHDIAETKYLELVHTSDKIILLLDETEVIVRNYIYNN